MPTQYLQSIIRLFLPKPLQRAAAIQIQVDEQCQHLQLYHFSACPYCMRVRHHIKRLNLPIQMRNIHQDARARIELLGEGGKEQVPCLRIEEGKRVRWLYESDAILHYLNQRFAEA